MGRIPSAARRSHVQEHVNVRKPSASAGWLVSAREDTCICFSAGLDACPTSKYARQSSYCQSASLDRLPAFHRIKVGPNPAVSRPFTVNYLFSGIRLLRFQRMPTAPSEYAISLIHSLLLLYTQPRQVTIDTPRLAFSFISVLSIAS